MHPDCGLTCTLGFKACFFFSLWLTVGIIRIVWNKNKPFNIISKSRQNQITSTHFLTNFFNVLTVPYRCTSKYNNKSLNYTVITILKSNKKLNNFVKTNFFIFWGKKCLFFISSWLQMMQLQEVSVYQSGIAM